MKNNTLLLNLIDKEPIAVVGLGVSNLPLVDFILGRGADVTVYDKKTPEELGARAKDFEALGVRFVYGEDYLSNVREKLIFRTPGIRPDAINAPEGAYITSEMELFFEISEAKKVAITGSDGKTTTTTLTHLFFDAQKKRDGKGKAFVGGNIGAPLLPMAMDMTENDVAVLELSSFQLTEMRYVAESAAITNITPNHLNWHTDMAEYVEAKKNIFGKDTKRLVLNADNTVTASICPSGDTLCVFFSRKENSPEKIIPTDAKNAHAVYVKNGKITYFDGKTATEVLSVNDIKLPGAHNVENYMTAIALTYGEVDTDIYTEIAKDFGGVEHRLELVATVNGIKYYNSSIDSSPTRTAAALSALDEKPIVICGGAEKGISFEPLASVLCEKAKAVVLNGDSAKSIKNALVACPCFDASRLPVYERKDLASAFSCAVEIATEGDTILLSPASTSFDQFKNFEERGKYFKSLVLAHENKNQEKER